MINWLPRFLKISFKALPWFHIFFLFPEFISRNLSINISVSIMRTKSDLREMKELLLNNFCFSSGVYFVFEKKIGLLLCSMKKAACMASFCLLSSWNHLLNPTLHISLQSPVPWWYTHHLEHTCDWKFLAPSESLPVLNSRSTSPNIIFSTTKESGNNFYSINRLSNVINVNLECTIDTYLNIFPGSSPMKWYYPNDIDNIVACFQIYIFGKQA